MAYLYPHKIHGWRIVFRLYLRDGSEKIKNKHVKSKTKAHLIFQDAERLEVLAANNRLTHEELTYFVHMKYVTADEAMQLSDQNISIVDPSTIIWDGELGEGICLANIYREHVRRVGSAMTKATHPSRLARILDYFQNILPLEVTKDTINNFIMYYRDKDYSKATINKYLTALRIMFDPLVEKGILKQNPARQVKYFSGLTRKEPRILYPDEFKYFLTKIGEYSYLCRGYFTEMILTSLYTGLRRYELVYLERDNVNLKQGTISVVGKGGKPRRVDIHPTLIPALESVLIKNDTHKGKYFFGGNDEPLVRYDEASKAFVKFRRAAKLPEGIKLHSLRHTWISYLLASGADLEYVRQGAGHEKLSTTQQYVQLIPREESPILRLSYEKYATDSSKNKTTPKLP